MLAATPSLGKSVLLQRFDAWCVVLCRSRRHIAIAVDAAVSLSLEVQSSTSTCVWLPVGMLLLGPPPNGSLTYSWSSHK